MADAQYKHSYTTVVVLLFKNPRGKSFCLYSVNKHAVETDLKVVMVAVRVVLGWCLTEMEAKASAVMEK